MRGSMHKLWLKITAAVVGSFGPIFFLGTIAATREPARWSLDLLSWPLDGATRYSDPDTMFLSALTGGFLLGWFLLDSAGSIASGSTLDPFKARPQASPVPAAKRQMDAGSSPA